MNDNLTVYLIQPALEDPCREVPSCDENRLVTHNDTRDSNHRITIDKKLINSSSSSWKQKEKRILLYSGIVWFKIWKFMKCQRKLVVVRYLWKVWGWAVVRFIKDNIKPTIWKKPDGFVLHVRKSNLNSGREPELILKSILDLACTLKSISDDVSISNIIVYNDKYNEKDIAVNSHLKWLCIKNNSFFIHDTKTWIAESK